MAFSDKVKQLRTEKDWSQEDLAEKVGVSQKQISAYENGVSFPSQEILIKITEIFDVSLDYLVLESAGQSNSTTIKDRELLRYFQKVDNFSDDERRVVKEILNLVVVKNKAKSFSAAIT
jgi:transcriptional regulator with XRE-family HTH domain